MRSKPSDARLRAQRLKGSESQGATHGACSPRGAGRPAQGRPNSAEDQGAAAERAESALRQQTQAPDFRHFVQTLENGRNHVENRKPRLSAVAARNERRRFGTWCEVSA
jgi:hypothetical protein